MEFHHDSVMLEETVEGLVRDPAGTYVDCTLGGAGHSSRIADLLEPEGRVVGIDQDAAAIAAASERLKSARCHVDIVHANFSRLEDILLEKGIREADGILFDLGVSSHQIDTAARGFSYMRDAPLDMRMDTEKPFSAYDVVNGYEEGELARIFRDYGEERWSKRIAAFLVDAREKGPLKTTGELVDIICKAVPKAARQASGGHPAKRVFQAIRIEVNDELGILEHAFRTAVAHLKPGGRLAIITFHSLEDRIAKRVLKEMSSGCICPRELPVCVCHHQSEIRLLGKPMTASAGELERNPRSRSARLRLAEKLSKDVGGNQDACKTLGR